MVKKHRNLNWKVHLTRTAATTEELSRDDQSAGLQNDHQNRRS